MKIEMTEIPGLYVIEAEPFTDHRGGFFRSYCENEFKRHGIPTGFAQCNVSLNNKRGTLRGMHFQTEPHGEGKLVQCVQGSIFDVVVDVRPDSPTCGRWLGFELSATNHRQLFIDKGLAHGFQTLEDNSSVHYQMTDFYVPEAASGVRFDDPAFGIKWPIAEKIFSEKDTTYPDFQK